MTSTLIHYISLPCPPASPPSHHPPALSTRLILSISLPSVCHSKFLPHRSLPPFHFTSVLFLYSFFPAHYQRSPNDFLYLSQFPLIRCSLLHPFSTSLLCLSAFLFFSFTFFFITFFTFWNSKWASEWGRKGDISGTIVGATWAGIWESAHLLGFSPYHNHL